MGQGLLVIIDDEQDILDLLEYNFLRQGYEVEVFDNARQAWEFMSENRPDIILCDWMMPEMTGLEFCRLVKGHIAYSDIPFVMVTCRGEQHARKQALQTGVSEYIVKPVQLNELLNRVKLIMSQALQKKRYSA